MIDPKKQYKTRDGREVRIYAVDGSGNKPVHGASLSTGKGWTSHVWSADGRFYDDMESLNDLIEVRPRIQREVWVNVYAGHEHVYSCKIDAENGRARHCIACVKLTIDCKEGEGL